MLKVTVIFSPEETYTFELEGDEISIYCTEENPHVSISGDKENLLLVSKDASVVHVVVKKEQGG